eukprot:5708656-Prymnesium_polylepis.1
MGLTYARRAVGCGPRRWELQDPRTTLRSSHGASKFSRAWRVHKKLRFPIFAPNWCSYRDSATLISPRYD